MENICKLNHKIKSPIYVYSRDEFDEYANGKFVLPEICTCGVELIYEEPKYLVLIENGICTNEAIFYPKEPLNFIYIDIKLDL